jgi:thermitase
MWLTTRSLERGSLVILFVVGLIAQFVPYGTVRAATVTLASDQAVDSELLIGSAIYLIQFQPNVSTEERDAIIAQMGGVLLRWLPALHVAKVQLILPTNQQGRQAMLSQVSSQSAIAMIEADLMVEGVFDVNDPATLDPTKSYTPPLLHLFPAWDYTTGSRDVVIAVLDSGITNAHPEFTDRILPGYDFINDDNDPEDDHGHGTHVAGIAAAAINNGIGMAGICGECSILPVKVLNKNNAGTWSGVAEGLVYAVDQGADIVVLSLGSKTKSQIIEEAVNYAIAHNVLIVAAAGNANSADNFYPAAFDGVLGVGATDKNDEKWILSNFGTQVDVVAPGDGIYSTFNNIADSAGGYAVLSGTSMATPHVAGLAGLLLTQNPTRTAAELLSLIETTATDLGQLGYDNQFGFGRIDALAALQAEETANVEPAMLSGVIWHDSDLNGLHDETEQQTLGGIQIAIYDENLVFVTSTTSNEAGYWTLNNLRPDAYTVRAEVPSGMMMTGATEIQVTLEPASHREGLDFGFAPLPALMPNIYFPMVMQM